MEFVQESLKHMRGEVVWDAVISATLSLTDLVASDTVAVAV